MKSNFKKLTALLLSLLLVFSAMGIQALAANIVIGEKEYDYEIDSYIDENGNEHKYVTLTRVYKNVESYTIPDTIDGYPVERIGSVVFNGCNKIKNITIPDSVIYLEDNAFLGTEWYYSLPKGDIYIGNIYYMYNGPIPDGTNIVIKEGTKAIAGEAFYHIDELTRNNYGLVSVTIPDSVECIAERAFKDNAALKSVKIPDSVRIIGADVFSGCDSLKNLAIPDSVIETDGMFVGDCESLETLSIGSGITQADALMFRDCPKLKNLTVSPNNKVFHSAGNCVVETATKTLIGGCAGSVIPSDGSVTSIAREAFYDVKGLKNVIIPDAVTTIGYNSFYNCTNIESLHIGSGVEEFYSDAFAMIEDLKYVSVSPENLYYIAEGNCIIRMRSGWGSVTVGTSESVIPDDGTIIGIASSAFSGRKGLKKIVIPDGVDLSVSSFANCTNLKEVVLPSDLKYLPVSSFWNCTSLVSITIPGTVSEISYYAFKNCTSLETVIIEEGVTEIYNDAFCNCKSLKYLSLPESLTTIKEKAFYNCYALESMNIPKNVTVIEKDSVGMKGYAIQPIVPYGVVPGFKIYGYTNSAAEVYADENGIEFVSIGEVAPHTHIYGNWTTEKQATMFNAGVEMHKCTICGRTERRAVDIIASNEVVNEETGITAVYPEGAYDYDDIELQAQKVTSGSIYDAVKASGNLAKGEIIDISTTHDGEKVQPNEPVWIVVPLPAGYSESALSVYFVNDDGSLEKVPSYVKNGYVYFEASHFSPYAIVDGSVKLSDVCDCMCHKTGFMGFIYKIMRIFWKVFGTNKTCDCGAAHY